MNMHVFLCFLYKCHIFRIVNADDQQTERHTFSISRIDGVGSLEIQDNLLLLFKYGIALNFKQNDAIFPKKNNLKR